MDKPIPWQRMTMTGTGNHTHFIRYKKSSSIQALGDSTAPKACQRMPLQPSASIRMWLMTRLGRERSTVGGGRDPSPNGELWPVLQGEAWGWWQPRTDTRMNSVCLDKSSLLAGPLRGWISGLKRCLVTLPLGDKVPECLVQTRWGHRENNTLWKKALGCTLSKGECSEEKPNNCPWLLLALMESGKV